MSLSRRAVGVSLVCALAGMGVGLATTGASASALQPASESGARAPKLVLAKFHADWCPHCRVLNPVFDHVQKEQAEGSVLFVRIDRTNKANARQAEFLTAELGLGQHWKKFGKRTGLVVLFDAETGRVVEEFGHSATATDINEAIAAAS